MVAFAAFPWRDPDERDLRHTAGNGGSGMSCRGRSLLFCLGSPRSESGREMPSFIGRILRSLMSNPISIALS